MWPLALEYCILPLPSIDRHQKKKRKKIRWELAAKGSLVRWSDIGLNWKIRRHKEMDYWDLDITSQTAIMIGHTKSL